MQTAQNANVGQGSFVNNLLSLKVPSGNSNSVPAQLANGQPVQNGEPSCNLPVIGSALRNTANWLPSATQDSGIHQRKIYGCGDSRAWSYNSRANVHVPSMCWYKQPTPTGSGVPIRPGCTNVYSMSYDPQATIDNGQCAPPMILGCTDPMAKNFQDNATVDSGSCWYDRKGCTDRASPSFDWRAMASAGAQSCCGPIAPGVPTPCTPCCDQRS